MGDVGADTWEEVDYLPIREARGANFGWPAYEGTARLVPGVKAPGEVAPIFSYTHSGKAPDGLDPPCAIVGGYVVRDRSLPSLYGRYLYGDYCSGELRSFVAGTAPHAAGDRPLGLTVDSLSSFGIDDSGHLYAVSLDGPVYRLVDATVTPGSE